jgi:hypothetical protein
VRIEDLFRAKFYISKKRCNDVRLTLLTISSVGISVFVSPYPTHPWVFTKLGRRHGSLIDSRSREWPMAFLSSSDGGTLATTDQGRGPLDIDTFTDRLLALPKGAGGWVPRVTHLHRSSNKPFGSTEAVIQFFPTGGTTHLYSNVFKRRIPYSLVVWALQQKGWRGGRWW